jgi:putative signal transducing protein
MDTPDRFVEVYRTTTGAQAHLLRNLLDDAGIEAQVENDLLQGVAGEIPLGWATAPRVLVPAHQQAEARAVIERFRTSPPPPQRARSVEDGTSCLACGAAIPEDADSCPRCRWSYESDRADE